MKQFEIFTDSEKYIMYTLSFLNYTYKKKTF